MKTRFVACALACLFLPPLTALANPINSRPVTVGPAVDGVDLQTILNNIYGCTGCVDASSDQSTAALWTLPVSPPVTIDFTMAASFTAVGTASDAVGIYSGSNLVDIFTTSAGAGESASFTFNANGTVTIGASGVSNCTEISCGTFLGISQSEFGFYLQTGQGLDFFTEDSLNGGSAHALAYVAPSNDLWSIAFEDTIGPNADTDYNDRVITVQSITGVPSVPEPTSFSLMGLGLLGSLGFLRRKLNR